MKCSTIEQTGERAVPNQFNLYEFERIYRLVSELYGSEQKMVLDYGCGTGYGSSLLAGHFGKVIGVDVSEEAIDYCRCAYTSTNLEFRLCEQTKQPFNDESFDCVFSFQTLEHVLLEFAEKYIRKIWQMLNTAGRGIITTPNSSNYFGGFSGNPFHVKEYTKRKLEALFAKVIPKDRFCILAVEDVLSTRVGIVIRKFFRVTLLSRALAKAVVTPLKVLERGG